MKKNIGFLFSFLLSSFSLSQTSLQYICPMYCTGLISDKPGTCPECRMELEDKAVVENPSTHKLIQPWDAWALASDTNYVFLDVRTHGEFSGKNGHIENALNIPIDDLSGRTTELKKHQSRMILAYCSHGIRSARAARLLQEKGYTIFSIIGGTTKWTRDGLPLVVRPK